MHAAAEAGQVGAMLLMIEAGAFIDEQVGALHTCVLSSLLSECLFEI